MDILLLIKAAVMGIVEGLTEFLPISSTGHLILAGHLLDLHGEKMKVFEIFIQMGAILAIVWEYRVKIWGAITGIFTQTAAQKFTLHVFLGCAPIISLALIFGKKIKAFLFTPVVVAMAFIVGGIIILMVEKLVQSGKIPTTVEKVDDMTWQDALKVGFMQCFGLIPGMSRSGSTIIGSLLLGFSRTAATEFSFFLGIPVLAGASLYSLYKARDILVASDFSFFAVGFIFAFISAFLCVRWLLRFVSTHTFNGFAWYRIIFGLFVLITYYSHTIDWVAEP